MVEKVVIMVENLLQGGGKIAIRYKSPGNFNPESVRLDLDDGDSESMASHSSWLDRD